MTWRLSDLPVETRLAAERAAAANGRPLEVWLVEMVRATLAVAPPADRESTMSMAATIPQGGMGELPVDACQHPPVRDEESAFAVLEPVGLGTSGSAEDCAEPSQPAPAPTENWQLLHARPVGGTVALRDKPQKSATPARRDSTIPPRPKPRPVSASGPVIMLPLTTLCAPQDRLRLDGEERPLPSLAADIAAQGVREPVLVRRAKEAGLYEIVAGERRRLAAIRAGKTEIPAIIVEADDTTALLLSLRENLESGDFTPLDEARAYLRLLTVYRLNPTFLSDRLAIERTDIASSLRLLGLPQRARQAIESGRLTRDQAFHLLDSVDPDAAAEKLAAAPEGNDGSRGDWQGSASPL